MEDLKDKFILKISKPFNGYKPVMIDSLTYEKLYQVKEDTGITITRIATQAIEYALEHLTIED